MNALPLMARAADWFRRRLLAEPGSAARVLPRPAPGIAGVADRLEWSNTLLSSARFRHGHIELLRVPGRLAVLHVCLFPPLDDAAPIFGFDMIAGPARVTGIFLDFSPVVALRAGLRLSDAVDATNLASFAEHRALPPWGSIFSADMLAIRPADLAEVERAVTLAQDALTRWLAAPRQHDIDTAVIANGQARYVAGQRRNEHTLRMLSGFIGAEPARRFIDEILFPPVVAPKMASLAA